MSKVVKDKRLTRRQAIRQHCIDCSGGSKSEVRLCPIKHCPLYTYRMGYEIDSKTGKRIARGKTKDND